MKFDEGVSYKFITLNLVMYLIPGVILVIFVLFLKYVQHVFFVSFQIQTTASFFEILIFVLL